jgi:hypothetical protein
VVIVKAAFGKNLWDAELTGISVRSVNSHLRVIDAYRVHYTGWNTRYTEWIEPSRVLKANKENRRLQVRIRIDSVQNTNKADIIYWVHC